MSNNSQKAQALPVKKKATTLTRDKQIKIWKKGKVFDSLTINLFERVSSSLSSGAWRCPGLADTYCTEKGVKIVLTPQDNGNINVHLTQDEPQTGAESNRVVTMTQDITLDKETSRAFNALFESELASTPLVCN